MLRIKLLAPFLFVLSFSGFAQTDSIQTDLTDKVEGPPPSTFYIQGNYFNAFRVFEDKSPYQTNFRRLEEGPITTGGIELGTFININKYADLTLGATFYSGGEEYTFTDSISDSTFYYKNRYRQIGIPLRLNLTFGNAYQIYAFGGIIPSSILHLQYSSNYTTEVGELVENDVETIKNDLASFQLAASVGGGLRYKFSNGAAYVFSEYRPHLTDTYEGDFVSHKMRLFGFGFGLAMTLN